MPLPCKKVEGQGKQAYSGYYSSYLIDVWLGLDLIMNTKNMRLKEIGLRAQKLLNIPGLIVSILGGPI